MDQRQELSNDSRALLENAARFLMGALEKQHWAILPFMLGKTTKEKQAQILILHEMQKESRELEKAVAELNRAYCVQFPKGREGLDKADSNS